MYATTRVQEQYYCNFGLNPEYQQALDAGGLRVVGFDEDGEARVLEIPGHPYYLATLFVPQARSSPGATHPLIDGLLAAARDRRAAGRRAIGA